MRQDVGILGWQWHRPDDMQTICISLQTDNHTNTSSVSVQACPTNIIKSNYNLHMCTNNGHQRLNQRHKQGGIKWVEKHAGNSGWWGDDRRCQDRDTFRQLEGESSRYNKKYGKQVCVQLLRMLTTWHCLHLLLKPLIDNSCPSGPQ